MCDVVNEMLFKHEAPVTNGVEKRLLERASVDTEPVLKENDSIERIHLAIELLVRVNLFNSYQHDYIYTHF